MSDSSFHDLVERLRANDGLAAAQFLKRYEPEIKRIIRVRLFRDTRMRRLVDSMDVYQSVWLGFFKALAELQLEDEQKVLHLLGVIAHRKVAEHYRRAGAKRRNFQRAAPGEGRELEEPAKDSSPSQHLAFQELVEEFNRRMSPRERELMQLRKDGLSWAEIAARLHGSDEGLRKQLDRAYERIVRELGLKE